MQALATVVRPAIALRSDNVRQPSRASLRLTRFTVSALGRQQQGAAPASSVVQEQQGVTQQPAAQQQRLEQARPMAATPTLAALLALWAAAPTLAALLALWAAAELPAAASELSGGPPASSYYVSLGLFLMSVPGLWSLIKRSPKAKIKRKTFEVAGPGAAVGAVPLDQRAHEIFAYFSKYNYEVVERGEVITFEGRYAASVSQAAALVLYTLVGLASTALVLSISLPQVGNWWYAMCLVSPAAGTYYWKNAERTEQFKVKMVTSDDEQTTDIVVEGDDEEIERFWKEMGLMEKGKVLVKGILS